MAIVFGDISKASSTATVTATVTVQNISLEMVENGTISYGTIGLSSTKDTVTLGTTPVANNNGNVNEDFGLQGTDSTSWTLSSDTGAETYFHKVCTADCGSSGSWANLSTGGYYTIVQGIATGNSQPFDLRVGTPTSTSDYDQQNVNVSVQASAN